VSVEHMVRRVMHRGRADLSCHLRQNACRDLIDGQSQLGLEFRPIDIRKGSRVQDHLGRRPASRCCG